MFDPNSYNYTEIYETKIDRSAIEKQRAQRFGLLSEAVYQKSITALEKLPVFRSEAINLDAATVAIGHSGELNDQQHKDFVAALQTFCPWKKGPFELFGTTIDTEWRSDLKWQRIRAECSSLMGQKIADIGCNNGYFMYRMAAERPKMVIGFEPFLKNYLNFLLLQRFAQVPNLYFEPLGIEHIDFYPQFFDRIFCLGILYHHKDPVGLLQKMLHSLKRGGDAFIDCQGIPGTEPVALMPEARYAGARGVWFLPTLSCLIHWVKRAGFREVYPFYDEALSCVEQRRTQWADVPSLADFLHKDDPTKTIEGYPAPRRFYLRAVK